MFDVCSKTQTLWHLRIESSESW